MANKQKVPNSPFLYDSTTDKITGVKNSDGGEVFFAGSLAAPVLLTADSAEINSLENIATAVTITAQGVKSTLTSDMTNANADITLTAVDYGADGDDITVTYADPTGNNKALSVSVSGTNITVSLATGAGGAITSTAIVVSAAINNDSAAKLLVLATYEGTGLGVVNAKAHAHLAGGVTCTPGEIGSIRHNTGGTLLYRKVGAQTWQTFVADGGTYTGTFSGTLNGAFNATAALFSASQMTATGSVSNSTTFTKLNNAVKIEATLTIEQGRLYVISQADNGTAGHTVTVSGGTLDGTNTVATFDAQYETLVIFGLAAGRGMIIYNHGSVSLA